MDYLRRRTKMETTEREIVVKAFSKDTCGIQSKDEVWYNLDKKAKVDPTKEALNKLNRGDTIKLLADFQKRTYTAFIVTKKAEKSGKDWQEDMVKFEDLLSDAHKKFPFLSIKTEKIEIDLKGKYALFKATAWVNEGVQNQHFQAHGDATADNIGTDYVKPHFIRMAETRAIVRALRLLTNNAKVAVEETEEGKDPLEKESGPY